MAKAKRAREPGDDTAAAQRPAAKKNKKSENDIAEAEQTVVTKKRWSGRMLNSGKKANTMCVSPLADLSFLNTNH